VLAGGFKSFIRTNQKINRLLHFGVCVGTEELKSKLQSFPALRDPPQFRSARLLTPFEVIGELFRRVANIPFSNDVVAVKNGAGFYAR